MAAGAGRWGRFVTSGWAATVARLAVGAVFTYSGWTKIVDIDGTIRSVRAYQLLPEAMVPAVGTALPAVELALAVLLLSGLLTRVAAAITVPISSAFFIGVASAWARGLQIECGCFGNGGPTAHPVPGYVRELVLNGLIVALCGFLLRRPASRWSLDGALGLSLEPPDDPDDLEVDTTDDELGMTQR